MEECEKTGIPMIRSLMLEYDNTDLDIYDQFMIGDVIMSAPIFTDDTDERDIQFPKKGIWINLITKDRVPVEVPGQIKKKCKVGEPCV